MLDSWQEAVEARVQQICATHEWLKQIEELLGAGTAEHSGAQRAPASMADGPSEMEGQLLSIVRDLNENIYQVAASLTQGLEKLEPSQATGRTEVDPTS
jgi:hypothetical protein